MLEVIGFITVCYLAVKLFPSAIKFTLKVALALLLVLMFILAYQYVYGLFYINIYL